jgi:hypothetical protein
MGAVTTIYSRITDVTVTGAQTRLLSDGAASTNWFGSLQALALVPAIGDVVRIHAWGTTAGNATGAQVSFKLYFNAGTGGVANLGGAIADTTVTGGNIYVGNRTDVWHFFAQITLTTLSDLMGNPGTANCSSMFEDLTPILGSQVETRMMGTYGFSIDTTVNNYLELTAQVLAGTATVVFKQCTIELMASP